ncbi:c-type cytochrome [Azospirillum argentinense]|uniref:Cytochrome C n=1 Tax=Azospirillum brasilense TaxID=192 RepID=A0A4D8Q3M1_AZOBR|nr:c-type cytochrome [Azospirillum argentinense]QCO04844.1 cytochrome C [Azospirillum argentinense]
MSAALSLRTTAMVSALLALSAAGFAAYGYEDQRRELERRAADLTGGSPSAGREAVLRYGCGSCHSIPGVQRANGLVGPPLGGIANRVYVAGVLQNTPDNLVLWLRDPQGVDPKTAMPSLGVSEDDARHIAAFLYTLK